jgi:hypothetical protein
MWKILSIIAALLAGGAAYISYENKQSATQEGILKARADGNLTTTNEWVKNADAELKALGDSLVDNQDKAETVTEQLTKVQADEKATREQLAEIKISIGKKETELSALQEQIKEIGDIEAAAASLTALTESIDSAKASIAEKKQAASLKEAIVKSTKEKIEDYRNLEVWQKNGKMESLNASVAMFIPDYNLVVINAGNNRGVVSRAKLDVKRGGSKIGELLVDVLQPTRAICKIASLAPGETIQAGDTVVVSAESKPGANDTAAAAAATAAGNASTPAATGATDPAPSTEDAKPGALDALDDPFGIDGVEPAMEGAEAPAAGDAPAPAEDDPFGL